MTQRPTDSLSNALDWYLLNTPVTATDRPFIVAGDKHKGDGSKIDDFLKNEDLYASVMDRYSQDGYIQIDGGDEHDLWKFSSLTETGPAHPKAEAADRNFRIRLKIVGNHDRVLSYPEALLLSWKGRRILIVHKFQGDDMNDEHWKWSRFLVRTFWRPLESIGIDDPTTPDISEITARPSNPIKHLAIRAEAKAWAKAHPGIMLISGHDHFAEQDGDNYFDWGDWCAEQVGGQAVVGDENGNIEVKYFAKQS